MRACTLNPRKTHTHISWCSSISPHYQPHPADAYTNTFPSVYSKYAIVYGKRWYSATKAEPPHWKKLLSGKVLAARMQLTVLGGVAWQKDDLERERRGRPCTELGSLYFAEWALQRLLSARLMQVRRIFLNFSTWSNTFAPLHFAPLVSFIVLIRPLTLQLNLLIMSADLPHSFARVSSNNMGINNLDPPQQKASYQQALKYNDRCTVQPANLSLGSSNFKALLIRGAATEKRNHLMSTLCHLYGNIRPASIWQSQALWSAILYLTENNRIQYASHLPGPPLHSFKLRLQRGPITVSRVSDSSHQAADLRSVMCHHFPSIHFIAPSCHLAAANKN